MTVSYNIYIIIQWQSKEFNSYKWQLLRSEHMGVEQGCGNIWQRFCGWFGQLFWYHKHGGKQKEWKTKKNKTACDCTTHSSTLTNHGRGVLNPDCCSKNGCPLLRVCVCVCVRFHYCVGRVKCRAQSPSMGHHTWPHVTSLFHLLT